MLKVLLHLVALLAFCVVRLKEMTFVIRRKDLLHSNG